MKYLISFLTVLSTLASAEDLLEIYQQAKISDPQVLAAEYNFKGQQESIPQAQSQRRPTAGLSANYSWTSRDTLDASTQGIDTSTLTGGNDLDLESTDFFSGGRFVASLQQNIYSQAITASIEQAYVSVSQGELQLAAEKQNLILRVAEAYFDILAAEDNLNTARAEKAAIAEQLEQAQQRFEVGLIAITDVREAQALFDSAIAQEIAAENELVSAIEALAVIVGQPYDNLSKLNEELPLNPPEPSDVTAWVDTALNQSLSLAATRLGIQISEIEIRRQRANRYPVVDVSLNYQYNQTVNSSSTPIQEQQDKSILIEFSMPIDTSGGISAQIRQAIQQLEESKQLLIQQERQTLQGVKDAYRGILVNISQIEALSQSVLSSLTALEATQAGFEVGTRTTVDVLIALQNLFSAERDLSQARYNYILNTLRLKQAAGTLNEQDLVAANELLIEEETKGLDEREEISAEEYKEKIKARIGDASKY